MIRRLPVLLLLSLVVIAVNPACTVAYALTKCSLKIIEPHRPYVAAGTLIKAEGEAKCTQRISAHNLTFKLEYMSTGGPWKVVDEDASADIPFPTPVLLHLIQACKPGKWRATLHAVATNGEQREQTDVSHILVVENYDQCDKAE